MTTTAPSLHDQYEQQCLQNARLLRENERLRLESDQLRTRNATLAHEVDTQQVDRYLRLQQKHLDSLEARIKQRDKLKSLKTQLEHANLAAEQRLDAFKSVLRDLYRTKTPDDFYSATAHLIYDGVRTEDDAVSDANVPFYLKETPPEPGAGYSAYDVAHAKSDDNTWIEGFKYKWREPRTTNRKPVPDYELDALTTVNYPEYVRLDHRPDNMVPSDMSLAEARKKLGYGSEVSDEAMRHLLGRKEPKTPFTVNDDESILSRVSRWLYWLRGA